MGGGLSWNLRSAPESCKSCNDFCARDFNPLSVTGPLLGHTYNYVECHGATFGPLVFGLIVK